MVGRLWFTSLTGTALLCGLLAGWTLLHTVRGTPPGAALRQVYTLSQGILLLLGIGQLALWLTGAAGSRGSLALTYAAALPTVLPAARLLSEEGSLRFRAICLTVGCLLLILLLLRMVQLQF